MVPPEDAARSGLHAIILTLGLDEMRVLGRIAERLRMGQEQYGFLQIACDRRSFRSTEARQELGCIGLPGVRLAARGNAGGAMKHAHSFDETGLEEDELGRLTGIAVRFACVYAGETCPRDEQSLRRVLLTRAAVLSVECERYRAVHLAPLAPLRREAEKYFAHAQHAYAQARGKGPCVVRLP